MRLRRCDGIAAAVLLSLVLVGAPALTQSGYRVGAYIKPDRGITETQTITLIIQVDGGTNPSLTAPTIGGLTNLQILSGPDLQSSSVWRNGRYSASSKLLYRLLPVASGPAAIPALKLRVDGQEYTTEEIRFDVGKSVAGRPPPRSGGSPSRGSGAQDRADVFMRAQIGSEDVWIGQAVPLTVSIYAGPRILSPRPTSEPSLASFWVEDIQVDPGAEAYQVTVEGRPYSVYPMVRKVLVPQTVGELEIEPFVMQIPVRTRSGGDAFDFFRLGRTQTVVRKTQPIRIRVRPLPTVGMPDDFSGAVGDYTMTVALDRTETDVNDAVALTATVEGEGFLRATSPPVLAAPSDLKVFDPKVTSSSRAVQGKLLSRKTWEWVLVPLAPGELKLPQLAFHYFDTAAGEFRSIRERTPMLLVRPGGARDGGPGARADVRLQRRDLAFIKPLTGALRQGTARIHERGGFVALLLLPLLWVPLVILVGRHREKLQLNRGLARARKARSRVRKRLRATGKRIDEVDAATFHEELARALVGYVADRFDRSAAGMTYQLADELLASKGLEVELRRRFRACLETCDFARFVPDSGRAGRRAEVLAEAREVMEKVDRAW